jgi:hypothetical protein
MTGPLPSRQSRRDVPRRGGPPRPLSGTSGSVYSLAYPGPGRGRMSSQGATSCERKGGRSRECPPGALVRPYLLRAVTPPAHGRGPERERDRPPGSAGRPIVWRVPRTPKALESDWLVGVDLICGQDGAAGRPGHSQPEDHKSTTSWPKVPTTLRISKSWSTRLGPQRAARTQQKETTPSHDYFVRPSRRSQGRRA